MPGFKKITHQKKERKKLKFNFKNMKKTKYKKIFVITGSRAEYGLLKNIIKKLYKNKKFNLKIIITGSHLSKKYGLTLNEIKGDEIKIEKRIDLKLKKDDPKGLSKSIAIGLNKFTNLFDKLKPDLILIAGDRFEIFTSAIAATLCRIPIAHIHGGELTKASLDDVFRHSITKMSHLHFVATQIYKKRVIQLGENPNTVFNVGGLGVDSIMEQKLLNKTEIEKHLNLKFLKKSILITFHPETLNKRSIKKDFISFLNALNKLQDTTIIFTMPNHDIDSSIIRKLILKFVKNKNNSYFFKSMGQKAYYSCCKYVDCMAGNSSSGLLEMPTFKKYSINLGNRQMGRIAADSVINCKFNTKEILKKINFALNKKNQMKIKNVKNPYGHGGASRKIISKLERINYKKNFSKEFYDILKP